MSEDVKLSMQGESLGGQTFSDTESHRRQTDTLPELPTESLPSTTRLHDVDATPTEKLHHEHSSSTSGSWTEGEKCGCCEICLSSLTQHDSGTPCRNCNKILCVSCNELRLKIEAMRNYSGMIDLSCYTCGILMNLHEYGRESNEDFKRKDEFVNESCKGQKRTNPEKEESKSCDNSSIEITSSSSKPIPTERYDQVSATTYEDNNKANSMSTKCLTLTGIDQKSVSKNTSSLTSPATVYQSNEIETHSASSNCIDKNSKVLSYQALPKLQAGSNCDDQIPTNNQQVNSNLNHSETKCSSNISTTSVADFTRRGVASGKGKGKRKNTTETFVNMFHCNISDNMLSSSRNSGDNRENDPNTDERTVSGDDLRRKTYEMSPNLDNTFVIRNEMPHTDVRSHTNNSVERSLKDNNTISTSKILKADDVNETKRPSLVSVKQNNLHSTNNNSDSKREYTNTFTPNQMKKNTTSSTSEDFDISVEEEECFANTFMPLEEFQPQNENGTSTSPQPGTLTEIRNTGLSTSTLQSKTECKDTHTLTESGLQKNGKNGKPHELLIEKNRTDSSESSYDQQNGDSKFAKCTSKENSVTKSESVLTQDQLTHASQKRSDNFTVRQTSVGRKRVSKHVCAGCGRRDCQGQFMKLLKEMIQTAKKNNFEIRNVVPDGNCMFAAIVDQLQLVNNHEYSPRALRHLAVEYLRMNPTSEDGTHYMMFLEEDWEDYLNRMSRDGQWGDHLVLQALSHVIMRSIKVLNGRDGSGYTDINLEMSIASEPLYLGHVGELHYVSLRKVSPDEIAIDTEEIMDDDHYLSITTPKHIDSSKKHIFLEEYIDPYCEVPAIHLGFLIRKFLPISEVLAQADRFVSTAMSFECSDDIESDEEGTSAIPKRRHNSGMHSLKAIGDVINGLYSGKIEESKKPGDDSQPWTDVYVLNIRHKITVFPEKSKVYSNLDVIMDMKGMHPGYTRLIGQDYPDVESGGVDNAMRYYLPNIHNLLHSESANVEMKDRYASQYGPRICSMFKEHRVAIPCLFWPKVAEEWTTRVRPYDWPSETLVQSIISEGCHLVSEPHPLSDHPELEFRITFGAAERTLCTDGLSRNQRFCYISFKALCSQTFKGQSLITSDHLRSIFLYACEIIPAECWSSKLGNCLFYLLECLISCVEQRNLPCYFIRTNNLIDHLTTEEIGAITDKLYNLRANPLQHFMSFDFGINETEAMDLLQNVTSDMEENFRLHLNVRQSVLECFVPISMQSARMCINKKNFKKALEEIQAAYEDRLTVATCEDDLPFRAFINEVVSTLEFNLQWWFLLYTDEKLGTTLSCDISLEGEPVTLQELIGGEVAKEYSNTLIPSRLALFPCSFCYDFAMYLFMKYRTTQAMTCLQLCMGKHQQLQQQIAVARANNEEIDFENPTIKDFCERNVLKISIFLYICCSRLKNYEIMGSYVQQLQELCAKRGTREPYYHLSCVWKSLGYHEESMRANKQYEQLPAGDEDVVIAVTTDVMSQTMSI